MIVTNRRKVNFYTHVVVTSPQDRSLHCRIWGHRERSFPSVCSASFWVFLLPVGIAELAVAICFKFLISFKLLWSFVATELESGNNSYTSEMLFWWCDEIQYKGWLNMKSEEIVWLTEPICFTFRGRVEPLLSSHLQGTRMWPLNGGWLLNTVLPWTGS